MLISISDKAEISGIALGKETLNEWFFGQIKSATSPALIPDITAYTEQNKTVVVISISEFADKFK